MLCGEVIAHVGAFQGGDHVADQQQGPPADLGIQGAVFLGLRRRMGQSLLLKRLHALHAIQQKAIGGRGQVAAGARD